MWSRSPRSSAISLRIDSISLSRSGSGATCAGGGGGSDHMDQLDFDVFVADAWTLTSIMTCMVMKRDPRRVFMTGILMIVSALLFLGRTCPASETEWSDADGLTVEGRAFSDRSAVWDRLPARAEGVVRDPVWNLSRHSAGIAVRFVTDSPSVSVRWRLTRDVLEMPHMPATGVSGVDLYARTADGWRWAGCGRPAGIENTTTLVRGLSSESREWMLYLPLYNGVETVEIGIDEGSSIEPAPERSRPITFYGTSITQGACASRPGMTHVSILGRRLDRPVVNLGFSGNGRLEPEVGRFLVEIDASVFVLDCLPNLDGSATAERTIPMVMQIRVAHPDTPIVMVEDRTYDDAPFSAGRRRRNHENRKAFREAYEKLLSDGVPGLIYVEGDDLLGDDGEATVDGSHPTDLGFMRQADALEPAIRSAIDSGVGR